VQLTRRPTLRPRRDCGIGRRAERIALAFAERHASETCLPSRTGILPSTTSVPLCPARGMSLATAADAFGVLCRSAYGDRCSDGGGGGAVEVRVTSSVGSVWAVAFEVPASRRRSSSVASWPLRRVGWRTGCYAEPGGGRGSSKPVIDRSSGTRSSSCAAVRRTPPPPRTARRRAHEGVTLSV